MDSIDENFERFFLAYKQLPIILQIGAYSVKDLSTLASNKEYDRVLGELETHIENIYNSLDGYMDDGYPWPRHISKQIDTIDSGNNLKRFYEYTLGEFLDSINPIYEYGEWGNDFLVSLYYYIFPEELEIAKNIFGENRNMKFLSENINPNWRNKLNKLISRGRKQDALKTLDKFIENVLPLFQGNSQLMEERRIAWLLRIELLRNWERKIEALAWICLECELNPENLKALIFKEQLKNELNLNNDDAIDNKSVKNSYLPTSDWEGIAGMQELKTILEMDVINPIQNPLLYQRYKVSIPNGILFYGPPGCGKTHIARKFADKIKYNFIEITPLGVASVYVHGTQQKIGALFKDAAAKAPTILFFDEFDAFVPQRDDSSVSHHYRSEVNEFLTQLNECHEKRILVIGATNKPKLIDSAVLRPGRLDIKVFISPPDFAARVEAFKMYMKGRPQEKIDFIRLAEYTELYTYAEIKNIVELTARKAAYSSKKISTDDIIEQIIANPPSLTEEQVEKMRKWKDN